MLDVAVASIALVLAAPVAFAVATAILFTSPGRVRFEQKRVGLHGRHFNIRKFRTMINGAEARLKADPALYQLYLDNDHKLPAESDPRITRVGRFLREKSLDELPQLWNVLMGHMSLVGPRPVLESELVHYGERVEVYKSVRPGLTGPWQAGGRSTLGYEDRVAMDVDYVAQWSFWKDIKIIAQTVPAVLRSHGAH